jgi:hypothetical protein
MHAFYMHHAGYQKYMSPPCSKESLTWATQILIVATFTKGERNLLDSASLALEAATGGFCDNLKVQVLGYSLSWSHARILVL